MMTTSDCRLLTGPRIKLPRIQPMAYQKPRCVDDPLPAVATRKVNKSFREIQNVVDRCWQLSRDLQKLHHRHGKRVSQNMTYWRTVTASTQRANKSSPVASMTHSKRNVTGKFRKTFTECGQSTTSAGSGWSGGGGRAKREFPSQKNKFDWVPATTRWANKSSPSRQRSNSHYTWR